MFMEVMKMIKSFKESSMRILLVEQFSTLALEVADRSCDLDRGHIVYEGAAEEFYKNRDLRGKLLGT